MASRSHGARGADAVLLLRRIGRRAADLFPLTPLGLLVLAGAGAALKWLAYPELDLVWLVVGYAAIGLVGVALLAVVLTAVALKLATRTPREREARTMETERAAHTGFALPALFFLPLMQVSWTWERPDGAEVERERRGQRWREKVTLLTRGHVEGVRRRVLVSDVFGLARVAIRVDDPLELSVLPHVGRLAETPLLVSLAGGDERPHPMGVEDGDRVELRRYAPGDPARFIHWKVFGRTGKLMVRMPERALSPARRTVVYQVAGEGDDASAAAARVAVASGVFGADWRFCADGASRDTDRADEALSQIVRSAHHRDAGARGLEPFFARVERAGPASAVIFCPPRPGPWLDRVVAATRARAPRTRFVIATDGVDKAAPTPLWRRLLAFEPPRAGTPSADLDAVIKALASTRADVIVLDRKSGRRLGKRARAAMRRAERLERREVAA